MTDRPAKTVAETRITLSQIMTPLDANILGKVFGGSILAMIDLTASATALQYCGHVSVTASFDRVDFHHPIEVGNLVTMEGYVGYVGRTSMEITIDVFATDLKSGIKQQTNTGRVTMVALEGGKPTPVPRLICETREDRIRFLMAQERRKRRYELIEEINQLQAKFEAASDEELESLLKGSC